MTLTWQALQRVPYDATIFVHLQGPNGSIVSQADRQPLDGRFPTSYWLPGQVVTDSVALHGEGEARPRTLYIGMYTWPSLQRLLVVDADGVAQQDNVVIIPVPASGAQVGDRPWLTLEDRW